MASSPSPLFPLPPLSQEALGRTSQQYDLPVETVLELISQRPENVKKRKLDRLKKEADEAALQFKERAEKHEQHINNGRIHCTCNKDEFEKIARYKYRKAYHFRTRNYVRPLLNAHLPVKDLVSITVSYLTSSINFNDGLEEKKKRDDQRAASAAAAAAASSSSSSSSKEKEEISQEVIKSDHPSPSLTTLPREQRVQDGDVVDSTASGPGWRALYNDPDNLAYVAMQRKLAAQTIADRVAHAIQFPFDREAIRRRREQAAKAADERKKEYAKRSKFMDARLKFTAADLAERITEHAQMEG